MSWRSRTLVMALAGGFGACATPAPFADVPLDAGPSRLYPAPFERVKLVASSVTTGLEFTAREIEEPAPGTAVVVGTRTTPSRHDLEDVRLTVERSGSEASTVHCLVQGRLRGGGDEDRTAAYCPLILYQFELYLGL